jgi:predicted signal transduction protein with EAL and GGDEF domain
VLKIDGSFARDMVESPAAAAIVTAVVLLGRSLQRDVVVEGVENEATVHRLRELGGVHLQGFHVAPPMPAEEFEQYLAERPHPTIAAVS